MKLKFLKFKNSEIAVLQPYQFYGITYKPIDRNLKTASVGVLKSTEHDVTLTSFVVDLSYPGPSNFYRMCGNDAREGAESLALIFAIL